MINLAIYFDNENLINLKYFDFKHFKKRVPKKFSIDLCFGNKFKKKYKIIFLIGFVKIIKINKNQEFITVHESDLPQGSGMSPIKHQIIEGKKSITCSLFKLNNITDDGNIYLKNKLLIKKTDIFDGIKKKQMSLTSSLIIKFLKKYPNIKAKKQTGKRTFFKKLTSNDDKIDINRSIKSQFDKLRSTNHYKHKNFFYIYGKKFYLKLEK
jgi:methionyl-tRNA formyltransferase